MRTLPRAVSLSIQFGRDARIRSFLNYEKFHQLHQDLAFLRIFFQSLGVCGYTQPKRNVSRQLIFRNLNLALPLYCDQFPALFRLLPEIRLR